MPIKIATWNVNSIKSRLSAVTEWLKESQADIVLLQELKCETQSFPYMEIEELGYNIAAHGQKTYNGVAILSKFPIDDVVKVLDGDDDDTAARYIEGVITVNGEILRVASIYVPNGQEEGSDKFQYKLKFLDRLKAYSEKLLSYDEPLIWGGDYNVAAAANDVYDPVRMDGMVCFHPEERKRFNAITHQGFTDLFRAAHPDAKQYSWWDYRAGSYQQNRGMRIDMLLGSPKAADLTIDCKIDEHPRGKDKASDHTPVVAELKL